MYLKRPLRNHNKHVQQIFLKYFFKKQFYLFPGVATPAAGVATPTTMTSMTEGQTAGGSRTRTTGDQTGDFQK